MCCFKLLPLWWFVTQQQVTNTPCQSPGPLKVTQGLSASDALMPPRCLLVPPSLWVDPSPSWIPFISLPFSLSCSCLDCATSLHPCPPSRTMFFKDFIYLFLREGRSGRKRGRETSMCGCLLCAPYWGRGLRPRHVPWLSIELVTLWFAGWHSIHWATPARAYDYF